MLPVHKEQFQNSFRRFIPLMKVLLSVQQFQNLRELKLSTIEVLLPVQIEQFQNHYLTSLMLLAVLLPVQIEQF